MQLDELGLVFSGGLGDYEGRDKTEFHFRKKRQKVFYPITGMAVTALLSSLAAFPLDQQHLPSAWAALMDLGMEKREFLPGKDLPAACFPQTWSEMCQGGQGE